MNVPLAGKGNRTPVVVVTGGIASGKSEVVGEFARRGAGIIEADRISREVVSPGSTAWKKIVASFGRKVVLPDGPINRKALAGIIFRDARKRRKLERILHPAIIARMQRRTREMVRQGGRPLIVLDVPLYFETGMHRAGYPVIVVWVPKGVQIRRLKARERLSAREIRERLAAQLPLDTKKKRGDFIVDNSRSREATRGQVKKIWKVLTKDGE